MFTVLFLQVPLFKSTDSAVIGQIAAHGHLPEAAAQEASNQSWLKAKVETSLNDTRPNIPHDQVMAEMRAMLAAKKKTCATD